MSQLTISIEEAQAKLADLIGDLALGDELLVTQGDQVVARIVGERSERRERRTPGFAKGTLAVGSEPQEWPSQVGSGKTDGYWMAPDFDAPLEEFGEHME